VHRTPRSQLDAATKPTSASAPQAKGSNQVIALRQFLSRHGYCQPSCVEFVRVVDMTEPHRPRVKYVIGPDGSPLTIADLPAPGTKRWVIRRKAEVVAAVRGGLLSLEEACSRYTLTVEEFPVLAILDRPAWPGRIADDSHPAVPPIRSLPDKRRSGALPICERRPPMPAFFAFGPDRTRQPRSGVTYPAPAFCLSMISSENRRPLFRIMLWRRRCDFAARFLSPLSLH